MSKVFRTDIWIAATAYIRAESAEEAAQILAGMDTNIQFQEGQEIAEGLEISGERLESEDLPELSLSPVMTVYAVKLGAVLSSLPPITPNDFEMAHDLDESDDGAESDADDFRAFCEGATPAQLDAIIEKEQSAGRNDMAAIARAVKGNR